LIVEYKLAGQRFRTLGTLAILGCITIGINNHVDTKTDSPSIYNSENVMGFSSE